MRGTRSRQTGASRAAALGPVIIRGGEAETGIHASKGGRQGWEGNCGLCHRPPETKLTIVRVLHGARDMAAISSSGGFA